MPFTHFKTFKPYFFLFFLFLITLPGCTLHRIMNAAEDQTVQVEPEVLTLRGQEVPFELTVQAPDKVLQKGYTYKMNIFYRYADKTELVATLPFTTGNFIYQDGKPTIIRELSFPFTPEKGNGTLYLEKIALNNKSQKHKIEKPEEIARGVMQTSNLIVRNQQGAYAPETYDAADTADTFTFYFEPGKYEIGDYSGTEYQNLMEFLNKNSKIGQIQIIASHSPEQEELNTTDLAAKRAAYIQNQIKRRLETTYVKYKPDSVKFVTEALSQDLNLFAKKLRQSALKTEQVNEMLDVMNADTTFEAGMEKLKKLDSYPYLEQYVFPTLRSATVHILHESTRRPDYELFLMSKKISVGKAKADELSEEELRYAATLTPLLNEKKEIYEAAVKNNKNWQAYNNLGMVYLQMAKKQINNPKIKKELLEKAVSNLTYGSHRNPTAQTFYNLANAHYELGNLDKALEYYNYTIRLGGPITVLQQIFADKAAVEIETGKYDAAIASLKYAGESYQTYMNRGLAYMLKGYTEPAIKQYQSALQLQPNSAQTHYALAVLGARSQQPEMLSENLRQAIRTNKNYTQRAIEDLEFRNYHQTEVFNEVIIGK